jgi:hypothetical protein
MLPISLLRADSWKGVRPLSVDLFSKVQQSAVPKGEFQEANVHVGTSSTLLEFDNSSRSLFSRPAVHHNHPLLNKDSLTTGLELFSSRRAGALGARFETVELFRLLVFAS